MLKSLRVDNFKSLVNLTLEPAGVNLLLGPNNAGKTNLCHALRFLSLTSRMLLDDAAEACSAEPWNLLNVYTQNPNLSISTTCDLTLNGEPLSFTYDLVLTSKKGTRIPTRGRPFVVESELLKVSGGAFQDTVLLENNRGGHVSLLHEPRFLGGTPHHVTTTAPTEATMLFRLYDLETNQRSNLFKRYLASWGYFNLDPSQLRSKQARSMESTLDATGANLSSVLYNLHNAKPRIEHGLIEAAKLIEPRLHFLSFQSPDPEHVYMFLEDGKDNKFGVDNTSDGTLRYLAICYLLLTSRDVLADVGGSPVIMLEEPENGIYVERLRTLFEKIDLSGGSGQFIFTSHSPYFIDLFDKALDGVFIVHGGETYSTIIKPDIGKLHQRIQAGPFSLGDMHFRGLLG